MTWILIADVLIGYMLDLLFGDPYWFPHPVRFIGWLIKSTEKALRKLVSHGTSNHSNEGISCAKKERMAGLVLAVFVITSVFLIVFYILKVAFIIHPVLFHVINIYFIYSALATKCLGDEAMKVYKVLGKNDIHEARKSLAMLVGRNTEHLDDKEIVRGVVETTAENTVDGIISPLIYALIGSLFGMGAPLVYAFKAVSTLDSMIGYMNDKYINIGRASAKIDDAANYIPARLSGLLIPLSAMICGKGFKKSFTTMRRDRKNHKSPNCAYPEAAFAGALRIRLGGNNIYFGKIVEKPTIGDKEKELEGQDIVEAVKLMYVTSVITMLIGESIAIAVLKYWYLV